MWYRFLKMPKLAMGVIVPTTIGIYLTGRKSDFTALPKPRVFTMPSVLAQPNSSSPTLNSSSSKKKSKDTKPAKVNNQKKRDPPVALVPAPIKKPSIPNKSNLKIELPTPSGNVIRQQPDNILTMSYNRHNKQAYWVIEDLTKCSLNGCPKGLQPFKLDPTVKPKFQPSKSDFAMAYGDYEMTQLAAWNNHLNSEVAQSETYLMTNTVPMDSQLKHQTWHLLEHFIRCEFVSRFDHTIIVTGPLYKPRNRYKGRIQHDLIGNKRIPVPTHFFKIVGVHNCEGEDPYYLAYLFPNEPTAIPCVEDFHLFRVTLEEIDGLSGFEFSESFKDYKEMPMDCCPDVCPCVPECGTIDPRSPCPGPCPAEPCPPCPPKRPCPRPPGL